MFLLCGCNSQQPKSMTIAHDDLRLSLDELRAILQSSKKDDSSFDWKQVITVEGQINMKRRGQQFLLLGDGCLQLVIPNNIAERYKAGNFTARISGILELIHRNSDGIYPWYSINGIKVYPYCTFAPGIYLIVSEIRPIRAR